jgi:serine/threonine protein phosphatase 1
LSLPTTVYAIGDVHGASTLLKKAAEDIIADCDGRHAQVIVLGDFIDRGPDSAGVLEMLSHPPQGTEVIPVLGNHEEMLLSILAGGEGMRRWLVNGGDATVRSYGFDPVQLARMPLDAGRTLLSSTIPNHHVQLLISCYDCIRMGRFEFRHGHRSGGRRVLSAGDVQPRGRKIVVHGHRVVPRIEVLTNSIDIDTGAYASGRLTCLRVDQDGLAYREIV